MSLLEKIDRNVGQPSDSSGKQNDPASTPPDPYALIKQKIHKDLIKAMNKQTLSKVDKDSMMRLIEEHVNDEVNGIPRIDRPKLLLSFIMTSWATVLLRTCLRTRGSRKS